MSRISITKSITIKIGESEAIIDQTCKWQSNNKELETHLNKFSEPIIQYSSGVEHTYDGTNLHIITAEVIREFGGEKIKVEKGRMKAIEGIL